MSNEQKVADLNVADLKAIIKGCNEEILVNIATLKDEVSQLKTQNEILVKEMEVLKMDRATSKRRLLDLESHIKGKNLIFKGLSMHQANASEIQKLCLEVLKTDPIPNVKSTKILFHKNEMVTVLTEFGTENDVQQILKQTNNLKGTNMYIERDLNIERQMDKRIMLQLKKLLLNYNKSHQIRVRDDRLKIANKWFNWNNEKQLVCGKQNTAEALKGLYGEEFNLNIKYKILKNNLYSKN